MRLLLAFAIAGPLVLAAGGAQAVAAEPWWHIATMSSPASPAGEAMVTVDVANVGDAATPGTESENLNEVLAGEDKRLTTIVDKLPAGVTPKEAHARGGGTDFAKKEENLEKALGRNVCSISAPTRTVTCVYINPVSAYEQILVSIVVEAEPGAGRGVNEVDVSGAEAPAATARHDLALEGPASYGVQSYEVIPEEPGGTVVQQAGEHPFQLTTALMLETRTATVVNAGKAHPEVVPMALAKDLRFSLPPGLVGNPTPLPKCNPHVFLEQFSGNGQCPNDTVVGVAAPMITAFTNAYAPDPVLSPVYSLEPSVGEPARFGFMTIVGPAILDTSVRTGGDYGVVVTVADIPSSAPFIGSVVTLWGVPADARHDNSRNLECLEDHTAQTAPKSGKPEPSCRGDETQQPFLMLPTSCTGPLRTSVEADSWSTIGQFTEPFTYAFQNSVGEEYGQVGCNRLNFEPSIGVTPDGQQASTPTGLNVDVHVPQDASLTATGLAESAVRKLTVTLPRGVTLDPSGADGLEACSEQQIGFLGREDGELRFTPGEPSCPDAAKIAKVTIKTPLLPNPIEGALYLAAPAPVGEAGMNPFNALLAQYIVARDPVSGVLVKLAGKVEANPASGQLRATFESPQVPFEDAEVHFFGGARAPLGTPARCGTYATNASFTPWSGSAAVPSSSLFAITSGPYGTPCPPVGLPFAPTLTGGSVNLQAGAFTPFTTTMSREDGNQDLAGVQLHMPPGLSGLLTGVQLCGEAEANAGTCGPESLIGETTVSVGLGNDPFSVKGGRVYITGPYDGAPFGLSIVNPAKAGPFDLEKGTPCDCLVVRAKIEVDPVTAQLTVTTDTAGPHVIPTMIAGIPLLIKHVNVTIDRAGFAFNPTDCSPANIAGTLTSNKGATSSVNVPFQVTNCATLGFKPRFGAATNGKTSRRVGAGLRVKLVYPSAPFGTQANVKSVRVSLPKQLPSRLATLQHACPATVFNANPALCSTQSRVGTANAITPLLPVPLTGPAYFVSYGGAKFPELVIVLQGYGITIDLHGETFIDEKTSITTSTFKTIPDAPVGSFELTLPQGPNSALAANANLCAHKLVMPTLFTAQNGAVVKQNTKISVAGCPKKHKHKPRHRRKHK